MTPEDVKFLANMYATIVRDDLIADGIVPGPAVGEANEARGEWMCDWCHDMVADGSLVAWDGETWLHKLCCDAAVEAGHA